VFREGWMHLKFLLIVIFIIYNIYINKIRVRLINKQTTPKEWQLRLINEIPFFFLVAIIFTVYMKNLFSGIWALLVVILLAITISLTLVIAKKIKIIKNN